MAERLTVPRPDEAAALYRAHGRALRAFIASRLGDAAAVDDLCQETFVAALARGVPRDAAGPWLFGIARNKLRRHRRDARPTASLAHEPAAPAGEPAAELERDARRQRVRTAVAGLEESLREAILLRYEGGLGYRAIAEHLGLPHSTVQGRLKRARVALRGLLREELR